MKSSSKYAIVIAILFVLLVMVFTACGSTPTPSTPTPSPTWTPPPTATPVPPTLPPTKPVILYVCAGGDGVYVRSEPDMEKRVKPWPDGTEMKVLAAVTNQQGDWYYIQAPDGSRGYVPAKYLCLILPTPSTATPLLTYTPRLTYTPVPTATPRPPTAPPTAPRCISWTQAAAHIGETTCVSGVVYKTYRDPKSGAFFIDFDNTYTSFYGVSFQWEWDGLTGQCIELYGTISTYKGRPQMVIERKDQLSGCRR